MVFKRLKSIMEKRKQKAEKGKALALERREKRLKKMQDAIDREKEIMLSKPCALRLDSQLCTDSCVHFSPGVVFSYPKFGDHVDANSLYVAQHVYYSISPRCKLWKD